MSTDWKDIDRDIREIAAESYDRRGRIITPYLRSLIEADKRAIEFVIFDSLRKEV